MLDHKNSYKDTYKFVLPNLVAHIFLYCASLPYSMDAKFWQSFDQILIENMQLMEFKNFATLCHGVRMRAKVHDVGSIELMGPLLETFVIKVNKTGK